MQLFDLCAEEFLVLERTGQRRDALTARQYVHSQRITICLASQHLELPAQPTSEESEDLVGARQGSVVEFCELRTQCSDGTAETFDGLPVHDQDVDEAADAVR